MVVEDAGLKIGEDEGVGSRLYAPTDAVEGDLQDLTNFGIQVVVGSVLGDGNGSIDHCWVRFGNHLCALEVVWEE